MKVKTIPVTWKYPKEVRVDNHKACFRPFTYKVGYERCHVGRVPCVLLGE